MGLDVGLHIRFKCPHCDVMIERTLVDFHKRNPIHDGWYIGREFSDEAEICSDSSTWEVKLNEKDLVSMKEFVEKSDEYNEYSREITIDKINFAMEFVGCKGETIIYHADC